MASDKRGGTEQARNFADRFIEASRRLGNPLCVGLDPHLELIPPEFDVTSRPPASEATARNVLRFLDVVLDECRERVPIVKPQIAFFEQLGWRGLQILEQVVARARNLGLLVLLDAKRGDIGSTAQAYARAYLAYDSPCRVDALTVNPYLGLDSLEPFLNATREHGAGLFVLAKTSNPGARDFQDQYSDGQSLYARVAAALAPAARASMGELGWSSVGLVVGANVPADARKLRTILPRSLFLNPGFGAQGGGTAAALASFVSSTGALEGGIVSSSRGLVFGNAGADRDYRSGLRWRLDSAIGELSNAVSGTPLLSCIQE